jgi:hypothetical protein
MVGWDYVLLLPSLPAFCSLFGQSFDHLTLTLPGMMAQIRRIFVQLVTNFMGQGLPPL